MTGWRYCSKFYDIGTTTQLEYVLLQILLYWDYNPIGICMPDAFMFDGRHEVKAYMKKLKGILMWNL